MERKIGEIFEYAKDGKTVKLKTEHNELNTYCDGCYFNNSHTHCYRDNNITGACYPLTRSDNKNVVFKLIDMCKNKEEKRNVELTLEKAQEWYKQGGELKEVALQAFSESELKVNRSHTWEEFCENITNKGYNAYFGEHGCFPNGNIDVYPSMEYADAVVALSRLLMIRQEWIGDWEPDWNDYSLKYTIVYCSNKPQCSNSIYKHEVLSFPDLQMALEFLDDFKDLLEIAKSLL